MGYTLLSFVRRSLHMNYQLLEKIVLRCRRRSDPPIEDMGLGALRGARESVARLKPYLLIEKITSNEEELVRFVTEVGYVVFPLGSSSSRCLPRTDRGRIAPGPNP